MTVAVFAGRDSVGDGVGLVRAVTVAVAVAGAGAGGVSLAEMPVGVGGGAEGSGVMTVLAERVQAGSVRMSSTAAPA